MLAMNGAEFKEIFCAMVWTEGAKPKGMIPAGFLNTD